ncbi:hypothetical protein [Actinokineospora spheciospongiae]|uniref:hypothetical protein n=1 Tax=Actinokineospora spheciospongiae TaxID=909613 RepID=UPI000D7109AB|nr:hypothetical protein [Actinokineospora spheciospongiae]PWW53674.1 hypothetical protein DFQ13_11557 [Actinokineospora spheciospongiae]
MAWLLVILVASAVGVLVWLGYRLAKDEMAAERASVETERQVLDAEWRALEQTRQINDVFFTARDQLRRAERDTNHPTIVEGDWS